jgi:hypothetical protein
MDVGKKNLQQKNQPSKFASNPPEKCIGISGL